MQKAFSINDHYALYSAGLFEKNDFEVLLFNTIREEIHNTRLPGWEEEDFDDYMSWLYPRIGRAIIKYREEGSSFEAYIGTLVRFTLKEFISRKSRNYISEFVAWNMNVQDMYTSDNEGIYECEVKKKPDSTEHAKNPRQLLILVLKCCNYVSEDFLERISSRLNIEPGKLRSMIDSVKECRTGRLKKIELLRGKINFLFCRCMVYEKNLSVITDEAIIRQIKEKLQRGRNRLARLRLKLSGIHPDPSNSQIAGILGISKGSVDSSLFTLKKHWRQKQGISQS